jgi:hypothetical protein
MLFLKAGAPRTRHIYSQSLVAAYIYGVSAGHQLLEIDYLGNRWSDFDMSFIRSA